MIINFSNYQNRGVRNRYEVKKQLDDYRFSMAIEYYRDVNIDDFVIFSFPTTETNMNIAIIERVIKCPGNIYMCEINIRRGEEVYVQMKLERIRRLQHEKA